MHLTEEPIFVTNHNMDIFLDNRPIHVYIHCLYIISYFKALIRVGHNF